MVEYYESKGKVRKVIHFYAQSFICNFVTGDVPLNFVVSYWQIDAAKPIEKVFEAVKTVFTGQDDKV